MNIADLLIIAAVAAIIGSGFYARHRRKARGDSCCGCSGCSGCGGCKNQKV